MSRVVVGGRAVDPDLGVAARAEWAQRLLASALSLR